jgi:uncharacterized protein involved in type VI secretion and phage assembly
MTAPARARALDRRYYGVVEGIVVKNTGDPDGEGRVKVRFPWFDDAFVTEWCRVARPYAGNKYGVFFVPEEKDEVIVGFIHGDMHIPIVLGGVHNGKDKPSTKRETDLDQKLIRTKAGHEILLDDTAKDRRVRIKTKDAHVVDLSDKDRSVTVKSKNGLSVVMDDAKKTITIDAGSGHSMTYDAAKSEITIRGTTVNVNATTVNVTGTNIKLGGTAAQQAVVLGTAFMALFNAHTHTIVGIPTTPPVTPMLPIMLSQVTKTV